MLTIPCPFCGHRSENEFMYGGPVRGQRPENPASFERQAWIDYLTHQPNPVGLVSEKWWHVRGCGAWITLQRHTVTHDVTVPAIEAVDDSQNSTPGHNTTS